MRANFRDCKTGKTYHVQSFRLVIRGSREVYLANGEELLGEDDQPLAFIDRDSPEIEADEIIIGSERIGRLNTDYQKDIAYLKDRAKKHARSEEGRHLKKEAEKREYKSMGFIPKNEK